MDLELKKSIEVLLFVHDHPLSVADFIKILGKKAKKESIEECLSQISRELTLGDKPYVLEEISGGWQFLTRPEYETLIKKLVEVKKHESLTRAQLESLAVIAYSQPVTKGEVESIRGVNCAPVIKVLQERGYIQSLGKANRIGAPTLYGTSKRFLELFGMKDLNELPEREDILQTFNERLQGTTSNNNTDKKENDAQT